MRPQPSAQLGVHHRGAPQVGQAAVEQRIQAAGLAAKEVVSRGGGRQAGAERVQRLCRAAVHRRRRALAAKVAQRGGAGGARRQAGQREGQAGAVGGPRVRAVRPGFTPAGVGEGAQEQGRRQAPRAPWGRQGVCFRMVKRALGCTSGLSWGTARPLLLQLRSLRSKHHQAPPPPLLLGSRKQRPLRRLRQPGSCLTSAVHALPMPSPCPPHAHPPTHPPRGEHQRRLQLGLDQRRVRRRLGALRRGQPAVQVHHLSGGRQ